jgi:hypothetical protein
VSPSRSDIEIVLYNNGGFSLKEIETDPPVYVVMDDDHEVTRCSSIPELKAFVSGWRAKNGALKAPARAERARTRAYLIAKMAATIAGGMEAHADVQVACYAIDAKVAERAIARAREILEALKL